MRRRSENLGAVKSSDFSIELNKVAWVNLFIINLYDYIVKISPYLFVFGDDSVTCHMWANDVPGDARDV